MEHLSTLELIKLIHSVFPLFPDDRYVGILVDVPRKQDQDNEAWKTRRFLAEEWALDLKQNLGTLKLDGVKLFAYPDVGSNNAELPGYAFFIKHPPLPGQLDQMEESGIKITFEEIFTNVKIFLAPTQYSTTAPLKNAAKKYNFRAATMPGFSSKMIPALRVDYKEVNQRVLELKKRLDRAEAAQVEFSVDDQKKYQMLFDLRFRSAHASTGRFPEKGLAGNLPSGEAYIVPYEGEKGEPSRTQGELPVQIKNKIVLFSVNDNRALKAQGDDPAADEEQEHLTKEPAYGNMAELGFGVLADFGIQPIGEILQDEKLGFHIAFGRSEHFGGMVGPAQFSSPQEVIHLDRIFIPETQPRIKVREIELKYPGRQREIILKSGKYLLF